MTNEELVQRIKSGEKDLIPVLWKQVKRFIVKKAWLFTLSCGDACKIVDPEDLIQSGYLALIKAIDKYDPDAGRSFISYFSKYILRKQFRKEVGISSSRRDASIYAVSLDAPLLESDDDDLSLLDTVALPSAEIEFEEAMERLGNRQIANTVFECMQRLGKREQEVLYQVYVKQMRLKQIAEECGISPERIRQIHNRGMMRLQRMSKIRRIERELDLHTSFYKNKGLRAYNSTFSSVVEDLVLKREEKREQWERPRSLI